MTKFAPQPVSQATNFMLQKLVGRVVPASNNQQPLYAPGSGKACVYYKIKIEEEYIVTSVSEKSDSSDKSVHTSREWKEVLVDEQCRDFYLQDGTSKLFVNGSNRGACKIQSVEKQTKACVKGLFARTADRAELPPGVKALVECRKPDWNFLAPVHSAHSVETRRRSGAMKFTEKAFDVNEFIACLGVPVPNTDPFTGQQIQVLQPFNEESLTEEYFKSEKWSALRKKSWHALLKDGEAVMLSDLPECTGEVTVQPIPTTDMQPWMFQPLTPQLIMAQPQMYAPVQPTILAPVQVTPVMPGTVPIAPVVVQPGAVQSNVPVAVGVAAAVPAPGAIKMDGLEIELREPVEETPAEKILALKKLLDAGALNQEEFDEKKGELLGRM
jgi:hypothetical protein